MGLQAKRESTLQNLIIENSGQKLRTTKVVKVFWLLACLYLLKKAPDAVFKAPQKHLYICESFLQK